MATRVRPQSSDPQSAPPPAAEPGEEPGTRPAPSRARSAGKSARKASTRRGAKSPRPAADPPTTTTPRPTRRRAARADAVPAALPAFPPMPAPPVQPPPEPGPSPAPPAAGLDRLVATVEELVALNRQEASDATRWRSRETLRFLLTLGVAIVAVVLAYIDVTRKVDRVDASVSEVGRMVAAQDFRVTFPAESTAVGRTTMIRGHTPFTGLNHYVMVTPWATGDDWIQQAPVRVSPAGTFVGSAQVGTAGVGGGARFTLRVLATSARLADGPLLDLPIDAVFSSSVTVVRTQ